MSLPGIDLDVFEWPSSESIRLRSGVRWRFLNHLVTTEEELQHMVAVLVMHSELSYDTETSGLKPHLGARICGFAFSALTGERELSNFYIPIRHRTQDRQLPPERVIPVVCDTLTRCRVLRGHHLKFDALMSRADGIELNAEWRDSSILAVVHDENEPSFGLKEMTGKYVYAGASGEEEKMEEWMRKDARALKLAYKKRKRVDGDLIGEPTYLERYGYSRTPIALCGLYACHDTAFTWLLVDYLSIAGTQYPELYARETAIAHEVLEMEWWGLPVDVDAIHKADSDAKQLVDHWRDVITRHLPAGAVLDTTDRGLRDLFFNRLGMTPSKVTKNNETPSVDKEARKLLEKKYPTHAVLLRAVDRLAAAEKVYTTYAASWLRYVTPQHRVHSSYNQIEQRDEEGIPKTGRLGSSDPNAQNVSNKPVHLLTCGCDECRKEEPERPPTKSKLTISIRRYYIVPKGFVRVFIDLSQIELRVLAWFSQDRRLLYCYANDLDVHQMTADEVTGGNRKVAKEVNFGNNYGMTKIGLAKRLTYYADDPDRALADAEVYLQKFFETYAGIPVFRDRLANEMRSNGCMFVNPFGRPRRIPTIASPDRQERARAERMMMSSIISGTSADLLKEIILRTRDVLKVEYGRLPYAERGRQVQTIHDENVYDLPIAGIGHVLPKLMRCYTDWSMFERGGVPIRASCELSTTTWEDKRSIVIHEDGTFSWAA